MAQSDKPERATGQKSARVRERRFVAHYSVHFNGAEAVRFAGYKTQWPSQYATQLLAKPHVQKMVEATIKDLGELHYRLADESLARLRSMHNAERTAIFSADGGLLPPEQWPIECKHLLAGIKVVEMFDKDGTVIGYTKEVKLSDPKGIEDSILRATGRVVDRTQFLGKDGKPVDPGAVQPIINVTVGKPDTKEVR